MKATALNRVVYFAAALSNIVCGYVIVNLGQRYAFYFHVMSGYKNAPGQVVYPDDYPLPGGTLLVMPYVTSNAPIIVGYLIGIIMLGLLLFLDRGDANRKTWIPACLGVALLLGFFPLIYIALVMSLPFTYLQTTYSTSN
jgi:hypothetical protein